MPLPGQFLSIWDCPRIWSDILWLCPLGSWYNQQCVAQWWSPMHFDCRNGSSCYLFRFETGVHVWSGLNAANMHDVLCSLLANFVDLYFDFPISSFSDFWIFDLFVFLFFSKFFCFCTGSIISADFLRCVESQFLPFFWKVYFLDLRIHLY